MSLIGLLVPLICVGVVLGLIETYPPVDPAIRRIIRVVAILAVVIWLLRWAGFV